MKNCPELGGRSIVRIGLPGHPARTRSRQRRILTVLAAMVFGVMLVVVAPPAMACGCGGVVSDPGHRTAVDREVALLTGDGTTETIHMQLGMKSDAEDLGLLVPTPSPATVTLGDPDIFDDLRSVTRPQPVEKFHLFGPAVLFGDGSDGGTSSGAAPQAGGVQALRTVDLGPLEATTLRADDPAALQQWLEDHHYQMREGLAAQVKPYIQEKWTFVAVRLTQEGKELTGSLPPLVMTFASKQLVYPMRMSRAATDAESVLAYVLGPHRVQRTDPTATAGDRATVTFAGTVPADQVSAAGLHTLLATAPYLTAINQYFGRPSDEIESDFTFDPAPNDEAYHDTYTVDTYGIPIDVAIIGLILLIAVLMLGTRYLRRRREQ